MENLLSQEFLTKMEGINPPFTELGEFVRLRTYARFIEKLGRRETWLETVKRVTEHSVRIIQKEKPTYSLDYLRKEAEYMFENIYMLKTFPSGRSLWVAGMPVGEENPLSNFNCSFTTIESFDDYKEIFTLCMLGAGTGIRILKEDITKLPNLRTNVTVYHEYYKPVAKAKRKEFTEITFQDNGAIITVGDSKQGWAESVSIYFKLLTDYIYRKIDTIIFNYDNVRPKGEKLKTFGGRASGHGSIEKMFKKIHAVVKALPEGKVRPIDALDIANIIGENVVSGGVRRTAQIILFDIDDEDVMNAKSNLYTQDDDGNWITNKSIEHRKMSNNSIFFNRKPSRKVLHEILQKIRYTGEPGFINAEAGRRRRLNFNGVNPCGEILLDSKAVCNLTTTNLMAFVVKNKLLIEKLYEVIKLSVRIGIRMTIPHLEINSWDKVHQRDRLIGVSLTGYQDMVNKTGMNMEEQRLFLRELKKVAKAEAKRYSFELGINEPILVTTIKPEGTISTLPSVSSGIHFSHAPFYIKRVRITSTDPLCKACEDLGYPVFPEVGQEWETCDTKVIEFPMKAPIGKTKYDVSAIEQLEIYKMTMEEWTDHNTSITVHVRSHEWDEVEQWVWNNWNSIVGISFLALEDSFYPMLPNEAITETEYLERKAKMRPFNQSFLEKYEFTEEEYELMDNECVNGVCPVR